MLFATNSIVENRPSTPGGSLEGLSLLLVEDDDLIRQSLLDWLASVLPGSHLFGVPSQKLTTLALVEPPHVIVVDIALVGDDGVEAVRRLNSAFPDAHVVALVRDGDSQVCHPIMAAGASACLLIWRMHEELLPALRRLMVG